MRNKILPATLKAYQGEYAKVLLRHWGGESTDYVEEIIPISVNSNSQSLPNVNDDVLLVWDDAGDCYMIGSILCDNQPRPETVTTAHVVDNGAALLKITPLGTFSVSTQTTELSMASTGQLKVQNAANELIAVLVELVTVLIATTVQVAGSPVSLSSSLDGSLAAVLAKLNTFNSAFVPGE